MREQNEQEKQNELLRVIAEQNHEKLIQYDAIEDRKSTRVNSSH